MGIRTGVPQKAMGKPRVEGADGIHNKRGKWVLRGGCEHSSLIHMYENVIMMLHIL